MLQSFRVRFHSDRKRLDFQNPTKRRRQYRNSIELIMQAIKTIGLDIAKHATQGGN
jgi:hypothetical protein